MPSLRKSDEAKLLIRVLECVAQSDGWLRILEFIDARLDCRTFLAEFDREGAPLSQFGGKQAAGDLGSVLRQIETEGGRTALQFLLSEAALLYPYCKTALNRTLPRTTSSAPAEPNGQDFAPEKHETEFGGLEILHKSPGLISPVCRSNGSTLLFGCIFITHTPDTIDTVLATDTFRTVIKALAPGLAIHFQLEKERQGNHTHRQLLSAVDSPAVLINADRDILAEARSATDALGQAGVTTERNGKLVFNNKQIEAGLQSLLTGEGSDEEQPVENDSGQDGFAIPARQHSVCVRNSAGFLDRISLERVSRPSAPDGDGEQPWLLVRIHTAADLPEEIETVLQDHYDLSHSEAHLARYLTMTGSMNETVDKLGITRNTAKTHLRRIYEKTGVHTQLQLARLVHRVGSLF